MINGFASAVALALLGSSLVLALPGSSAGAQSALAPVTNLLYAPGGGPDQMMDLYWPAARPTATVLFIHGGSLQESGERRSSPMYREVCAPFVRAGIACASMDYRLAPRNAWPAMPNDVAAAIRKLRQLVTERGADQRRIFLFGHSSGCHLAAIIGADSSYLKAVGLAPSDVAGIIPMGCTLDRDDAAIRGVSADDIHNVWSSDAQDVATFGTAATWISANPANHMGAHIPPALVIVAHDERFMPAILEQGARFVRRMLEHDRPAHLVVVPGSHVSSISHIGMPDDPTLAAILRFIANPSMPF